MLTHPTWRFLLACFLFVALSFQGMAQANMAVCEQGHPGHALMMKSVPDVAQVSTDHADYRTDYRTDYHADYHANTSPEKSKTFQDKCSTCTPCCPGAAIITNPAIVIAALVVPLDFPALTVAEPSANRGRLDRPPRIFLA
ncbi:hypothetical protein RGU70_12160 [Herbaspirillum sp. RTI4]|uniref:hypothetical protein n=1 Tax=Herbaspirillum sp. RTI4 TaxID=3048640 RepID=UPI002AB54D40|nr:hypothetical protein [Herbaspirillum sp. RTI4]MDY7579077.1 hypothetical protein [Herbaspirillum sp. RTI4]MEA9982339.1 hypothetical protein [Herbaspirillum sp. RTI4]